MMAWTIDNGNYLQTTGCTLCRKLPFVTKQETSRPQHFPELWPSREGSVLRQRNYES